MTTDPKTAVVIIGLLVCCNVILTITLLLRPVGFSEIAGFAQVLGASEARAQICQVQLQQVLNRQK